MHAGIYNVAAAELRLTGKWRYVQYTLRRRHPRGPPRRPHTLGYVKKLT